MTLSRKPHPFEIVRAGEKTVFVNEGFVYKADTLERISVKPLTSEEGLLKPVWSTLTDKLEDLLFTVEGQITLYVKIEHEKPADVSFLKSCDILSAKVVTDGEKASGASSSDSESYSYIELAELDFNIKTNVLTIKQKLNSDIFILIWGVKESI